MIKGFRDKWLREFFENDVQSKKIPADIKDGLFRKLQMLDDATCTEDLTVPPSNKFERKQGKLSEYSAIRINSLWRLQFIWDEDRGEADEIHIHPHKYK